MPTPSKRIIIWICVIIGITVYVKYGVIPPKRLSGIELELYKRGEKVEAIAQDVKEYIKHHNGQRPAGFTDLTEMNLKYTNSWWAGSYELPTNQIANILVCEKPGLWSDKRRVVYFQGCYGAFMIDEHNFQDLVNGIITWKDLRIKKIKKYWFCKAYEGQLVVSGCTKTKNT